MIKFRLSQAVLIFLALSVCAVLINIFVVISSQNAANKNEEWLIHTYEVLDLTQLLLGSVKNGETGQRGFLLTSDEAYLEPYYQGYQQVFDTLQTLTQKTADNPRQQQRLAQLSELIREKFAELKLTIQLSEQGQSERALQLVNSHQGKQLMEKIRRQINAFEAEERQLLEKRRHAFEKSKKLSRNVILFADAILFSIVIISILVMKRRVIDPVVSLTRQAQLNTDRGQRNFRVQDSGTEVDMLAKTLQNMSDDLYRSIIELQEAKAKADSSAKIKSEFLANMSHEIRTPLNGIYGALQLLSDEIDSEKGKDILDKAKFSAISLITIVNDTLDFSKMEAGKLEISNTEFSLSELMEYLLSDMGMQAHKKGLKITISNNVQHNYWIGDPVRIKQILINILSNAIKFTRDGSIEVNLTQDAHRGGIQFTIQDSGIGMNQEQLSRLFERFEQADQSTSRKYGGTGLGMSITKFLVGLMHGTIEVSSEEGEGTRCIISLPLKKAENLVQKDVFADIGHVDFNDKRILIAEDNEINRMIIEEMLIATGASLVLAENGLIALEKFKAELFDLVLMDIQMPEMDGVEACKKIKQYKAKVPVIALTANVMKEDRLLYEQTGFDNFFAKPIDRNALLRLLSNYLNN